MPITGGQGRQDEDGEIMLAASNSDELYREKIEIDRLSTLMKGGLEIDEGFEGKDIEN